ncbi:MAG: gfo/Idh/MocA family oxidoreductase [Candidatus Abyssobacteria bacterium SURF_17]|jgi:predicted dehydrogenase|uniref:Gfo/Idh/MocA family oxidoreductase n=1 Tax=Candidatus Abyssobacteria bacterium SURF_17 TaxID=2093361 RepID=A0A419EQF7_9BACT|nr:MAG: gfo/Idh/MocA family oxidoreductase [Candidatus Abyssubacteria bacterium SURF_17]
MSSKKLKLCLVGCGMIGRIHAQACSKHRDDIALYACDMNAEVARATAEEFGALAAFTSYDQVLSHPDIEAVDLCLPHHLHMPATLSAFEAGKHVLLEKPMANSLAEADSLIKAASASGLVLAVSENFRFEPGIRRAVEIIARGDIGQPFLIVVQEMAFNAEVTALMRAYDWRRRESTGGGGVLFDRGVHLMAAVNQLGGPVRSVYALTRRPAGTWEVDETSVVTVVHESGVITNLIESWNIRSAPQTPMIAVYGTDGTILESPEKRLPGHGPFEIGGLVVYSAKCEEFQSPVAPALFEDAKLYMKMMLNAEVPDAALERTLARGVPVDIVGEFGTYNVYEASIMDFVECVRTGKAPHVGGKEARSDIELVFAAYESARRAKPVTLPLRQ